MRSQRVKYHNDSSVENGENISLFGSPRWYDYELKTGLKFLTESLAPPEGGVIVYYLFKNINNYYSIHICIYKKRIEILKRYRGSWSTIAGRDYGFEMYKNYDISVKADSGVHILQVNGDSLLEVHDDDIKRGCIGLGVKYCDAEFDKAALSFASPS